MRVRGEKPFRSRGCQHCHQERNDRIQIYFELEQKTWKLEGDILIGDPDEGSQSICQQYHGSDDTQPVSIWTMGMHIHTLILPVSQLKYEVVRMNPHEAAGLINPKIVK